ncbi:FAD/NAD(P)-binding protein [Sulfitobacter sp. F26169L]|uniref:FAD/NAD(P)-binding protein n=1 Tax=Sulfitobacter sp. F26169L TaxID=2996015 RepID=UPI002260CAE7|nr:FAD/NAD(P)-binding domain-containing protein [Sulfitobacter sp. F26169L]MCX7567704.1 FAD/NAD(P)-binding protein [Sulfitobacter sp. F26169L]
MTGKRKTIAIIGCGPKGLYALDSLSQVGRNNPASQIDLHIFEASPHPGAGPIYDPSQPDILLMNFPARMIDAWTDGRGPDFLKWSHSNGSSVAADDYVPRSNVGAYLGWCFKKVVENAPANINLTLHTTSVTSLRQKQDGWIVTPSGIVVDEVLVSTGHQDWLRENSADSAITVSSPYPISKTLTPASVRAGAIVACRGFALTFIDMMLALTEGRGGVFTEIDKGHSYQPSGQEPALIAPFSRSGRPMRAKVSQTQFTPPRDVEFWTEQLDGFQMVLGDPRVDLFSEHIWTKLLSIADKLQGASGGAAREFFDDWTATPFDAHRCRDALRLGYDIASGRIAPDIGWALAETWRRCYPQLIRWISYRELCQHDAALFLEVAAEMERLAFGPPAQNVGKLICLEEAGLISFDHLTNPPNADVIIDATIPSAGAAALSEPLAGLLRDGHVSVGALGGLRINADGQSLCNNGVTAGLSIIGRATEGCVLGNDTLSRLLHDLPERWAKQVLRSTAAQNTGLEAAT